MANDPLIVFLQLPAARLRGAFMNRVLLVAKGRVSHSELAEGLCVGWLLAHQFRHCVTRASSGSVRRRCIGPHLSNYAYTPGPRQRNSVLVTTIDQQRR